MLKTKKSSMTPFYMDLCAIDFIKMFVIWVSHLFSGTIHSHLNTLRIDLLLYWNGIRISDIFAMFACGLYFQSAWKGIHRLMNLTKIAIWNPNNFVYIWDFRSLFTQIDCERLILRIQVNILFNQVWSNINHFVREKRCKK